MKRISSLFLSGLILFVTVFSTVKMDVRAAQNYTVEFTYGDSQYVMKGGTTVLLADVLDELKVSGEVTAVSGSNDELFSFSKDASGAWCVTSHKAFTTEEWMDVQYADATVVRVVVTDGTIEYRDKPGDWDTIKKTKTIDKVYQGSTNTDFAAGFPFASVFIDEHQVNSATYRETAIPKKYGKNGLMILMTLLSPLQKDCVC